MVDNSSFRALFRVRLEFPHLFTRDILWQGFIRALLVDSKRTAKIIPCLIDLSPKEIEIAVLLHS